MKPLIVAFCISCSSAHAAQAPLRSPQFFALAPPSFLAAPRAPEARAEEVFGDYFHAEAEFLAADERYQQAPEGSAQQQSAAEARALAVIRAIQLVEEIGRREEIRPESWEEFALVSERMRREAGAASAASEFFARVEQRAWLAFCASATRELQTLREIGDVVRAAELLWRELSELPKGERRAAYWEIRSQAWDWAYALLDRRIASLPADDFRALEGLADEFRERIRDEDTDSRARDFYERARREAWSATRPLILVRLLSTDAATVNALCAEYERRHRESQDDTQARLHYHSVLFDCRYAMSGGTLEMKHLRRSLDSLRRSGASHFHSRHDRLDREEDQP